MSEFFTYVCTKSTADPYLPPRTSNVDILSRDVSDALMAISGGHFVVGRLAFFPVQRSVPNHLLCDGREVDQVDFPELYEYLGDSQGAAAADKFKLPNYLTAFAPAPTAEPETAAEGTTSTPPPAVPPPAYNPDSSTPSYGPVDSGGRYRNREIP